MFQLTLQGLVQIPSSLSFFQLPQAVNISVIFDFYQNNYMFALEFLPVPLGEKKMFQKLLFKFESLRFPS